MNTPHDQGHHGLCLKALERALLGASAQEDAVFEQHLARCPACRNAQTHLARVMAEQLDALEPVHVPALVWERIEARIEANSEDQEPAPCAQPWKRWNDADSRTLDRAALPLGLSVQRADPAAWQATAFAGVEVQPLAVARAQRQATMLVRMAAGSSYPPHRHCGPEECFVLSGDLWIGDDLCLGPGDFQRAESGSEHPVQATRGGCLLLIQTSLDDELIG